MQNLRGVNEALEECTELAKDIAGKAGATFLDLHTPLMQLGRQLRSRGGSNSCEAFS